MVCIFLWSRIAWWRGIICFVHLTVRHSGCIGGITITYTVQFPDGKQMDIKCCGCQDEPSWTEAVLFDEDGSQLCCTEPGDSFDGPWELQYAGIRYTVTIKTEHT